MRGFLALVLVLGATATGCSISQDEEMKPRPARTSTITRPAVPQRAVPSDVPVPHRTDTGIAASARSWAQGSVLHVGGRRIDVAPMHVDAWVVVRGGVYFLDDGRLWLTDLFHVRDTGLSDVERLEVTPDRSRVVVRFSGRSRPTAYAFDTRTGSRVEPGGLQTSLAQHPGEGPRNGPTEGGTGRG